MWLFACRSPRSVLAGVGQVLAAQAALLGETARLARAGGEGIQLCTLAEVLALPLRSSSSLMPRIPVATPLAGEDWLPSLSRLPRSLLRLAWASLAKRRLSRGSQPRWPPEVST